VVVRAPPPASFSQSRRENEHHRAGRPAGGCHRTNKAENRIMAPASSPFGVLMNLLPLSSSTCATGRREATTTTNDCCSQACQFAGLHKSGARPDGLVGLAAAGSSWLGFAVGRQLETGRIRPIVCFDCEKKKIGPATARPGLNQIVSAGHAAGVKLCCVGCTGASVCGSCGMKGTRPTLGSLARNHTNSPTRRPPATKTKSISSQALARLDGHDGWACAIESGGINKFQYAYLIPPDTVRACRR
jgi:hypothetical protein